MEIGSIFPFVSIIVPVYNEEQAVITCVESLLAQNYPADRLEIIFVDNKSKDRTLKILQPYAESGKILLLCETNVLNAYGARNTGVRAAKGEIVAFTDSDCEAEPNWLAHLTKPFQNQAVGCVAGAIIPFEPENYVQTYLDKNLFVSKITRGDVIFGANCAFRRSVFEEIGFFREDDHWGDTEILIRMLSRSEWKRAVASLAIVYHENVKTIAELLRQSISYGTQIFFIKKNGLVVFPTFGKFVFQSIQFPIRIIKRIFEVFFREKIFTNRIHRNGYILRPFLEWLVSSGNLIGYKFPSTKLLR